MVTREQIEKIYKEIQPHFVRTKDVEGYAGLFTVDAVWWPLNRPTRIGPVLLDFFAGSPKMLIDHLIYSKEVNLGNVCEIATPKIYLSKAPQILFGELG